MKRIIYNCDCCDEEVADHMAEITLTATNNFNGVLFNGYIGHLCSECVNRMEREVCKTLSDIKEKYRAALIEPEISNHD